MRWLARPRNPGWIASVSDDPELLEGLAAMGYVEEASTAETLFEPDGCEWCRSMARSGE